MASPVRYAPPAPARAKALPRTTIDTSLADPSSEREAGVTECERVRAADAKAVDLLNRLLDERGVSNVALAEVLGCKEPVVRAVRAKSRRRPLKVGFVMACDPHLALAYLDECRVELLLLIRHGA